MKKRFVYLFIPIITLVLEILPYGAVCNFAFQNTDGSIGLRRELFSYFDLIPFGYANFAPFLTAILTCVVLLLLIIFGITDNRCVLLAAKIVICVCIVLSFCPLLFGLNYASLVGGLISVSLIAEFIVLFITEGKHTSNDKS